MKRLLPCLLPLLLCACPKTPDTADGGDGGGPAQAPQISSLNPTTGPRAGGTSVMVNGANFQDGLQIYFGNGVASSVVVLSMSKVTAVSPPAAAAGAVDVKLVNPDGQSTVMLGAFTYLVDGQRVIDEARVLNNLATQDISGAATVSVTVVGEVSVPGVTQGAGQGSGVKAQVGFGSSVSNPPVGSDFAWSDAAYTGDGDGPVPGDLARDRYGAMVALPGATGAETKTYYLAARFSLDNGNTWTLADYDGSSNGLSNAQVPAVTVSRPMIDWCKLGGQAVQAPPDVQLKVGQPGVTVYGQVYRLGVTDTSGKGGGIAGQLGYGPTSADPSTWTWADASFNTDTGGGANDEYMATLPNPGQGTYSFAYRFALSGGPWRYCDADGSVDPGFTIDQAGKLTVTPVAIDRCVLQFPATFDARTGATTDPIYGRVWIPTVTDGAGQGAGVTAELGYGPANTQPTELSWQWEVATFNKKGDATSDEYQATLVGPAAGSYHYAYRFTFQNGSPVYCDLDTSTNGYSTAQAGVLTSKAVGVDDCRLVGPSVVNIAPSSPTPSYTGRVFSKTVTDAAGAGAGITAQVGWGPVGTAPSAGGWTFTSASYVSDQDQGSTDEYSAALSGVPSGVFDVAYRFRYQSGAWSYCDLNGTADGYSSAHASKLTVSSVMITHCKLQWVGSASIGSGDKVAVYGRVTVPGVTDGAGQGAGIRGQVGVGTQGDDASQSASWGWQEAAYNAAGPTTTEDEYGADVHPAYTGTRAVAFRFSVNGGVSWTYCDQDGSANGYQAAQQWALSVGNHGDFDWCNLAWPYALPSDAGVLTPDAGSEPVYGKVYQAGLTPDPDAGIAAWLGYGKKVEDPGVAWTWVPATFNGIRDVQNNEYVTALPALPTGTWSYAWRFLRNGGTSYCYGDIDGAGKSGGFNGENGSNENLGVAQVGP